MSEGLPDHVVMPRTRKRPTIKLYIGEWIRALGRRPAEVARAIQMNEGYLSELINGGKGNPSAGLVADIADFLQIPEHYFRQPPPSRQFLDTAAALDPDVLRRLAGPRKN